MRENPSPAAHPARSPARSPARPQIWDVFQADRAPACVQTVSGHGGTVTAVEFEAGSAFAAGPYAGHMFTASTDRTVALWRNAPGRELMLFPFYVRTRVFELKARDPGPASPPPPPPLYPVSACSQ